MTMRGMKMGQPLRFQRQEICQLPVFLARPVNNFNCLFPHVSAYRCRRPVKRLRLMNLSSTNSLSLTSRELRSPRNGWAIFACDSEPVDTDEDPHKFESLTSPAALEYTSDKVNWKTFSRLRSPVPWDGTAVAVTIVTYLGVFHGPLGVGGLSLVASLLHQRVLDSQTKAVSLVILQLLELKGAVWLVQSTVQQHGTQTTLPVSSEFNFSKVFQNRAWLPTSAFSCLKESRQISGIVCQRMWSAPLRFWTSFRPATSPGLACTRLAVSSLRTWKSSFMYRGFLLTSLAPPVGCPRQQCSLCSFAHSRSGSSLRIVPHWLPAGNKLRVHGESCHVVRHTRCVQRSSSASPVILRLVNLLMGFRDSTPRTAVVS